MKKLLVLVLTLLLCGSTQAQRVNSARMLSGVNSQTGTSYTFVPDDVTKLVTFSNAAGVTATLPSATTLGFGVGTIFSVKNEGTGPVTISPAIGTIDGSASAVLQAGQGFDIYSDGANFKTQGGSGSGGGGGGGSGTPGTIPVFVTSSTIGNSTVTDDAVNPTRAPNGVNIASSGLNSEYVVDTGGVFANQLACSSSINKVVNCPAGATTTVIGVALTTVSATGTVAVCDVGKCSVKANGTVTQGHWVIPSASVAGSVDDTGSASQPQTGTQSFLALTGAASGSTIVTPFLSLNTVNAAAVSSTVLPASQFSSAYYSAAGVSNVISGIPSPTANGNYFLNWNISGSAAVIPAAARAGIPGRKVAGTSDTITVFDRAPATVEYTSGSAVTVSVPDVGSTGFTSNPAFAVIVEGAGTVTFNRTTSSNFEICNGSTCSNGTSTNLTTGQFATFTSPDNANWLIRITGATGGGGGAVTSVGFSVPASSVFGATGSPVTTSGTLGLTTTGTSGGIPYFFDANTLKTSAALTANALVKGGGAGVAPSASTVTDDGTNPTRHPNGVNTALNAIFTEYVVDTGGVTVNHLVCRSAINKVVNCPINSQTTVMGIAQASVAATGTVLVGWGGLLSVISTNATTAGHWLIPSTSVIGDVDDTGSTTQPTTDTQTFLALSSVAGGSAVSVSFLTPDTLNAAGTGKNITINGSATQGTTNFNAVTPAAGANNQNLVFQSSNSGGTTSVSVEVPIASAAQGGIIAAGGTAKKILVAGSPSAYIDFPDIKIIPFAACNDSGTPSSGSGVDIPASGGFTPACVGTTTVKGAAQGVPATGAYITTTSFALSKDWDTSNQPFISVEYGSGTNTSGTVIWTISTGCTKLDGSASDDPSLNTESAMGTQTMTAANRSWGQNMQLTTLTSGNGCIVGSPVTLKVAVSGTGAAAINAYRLVLTQPRLLTVQAN